MASKVTTEDFLFAKAIEAQRYKTGKSRQHVADAVGVSHQQIKKYEDGQDRVSIGRIIAIAKALDVGFLEVVPEQFLDLKNIDNLAIYLWQKLDYKKKKSIISILQEMKN